MSSAATRRVPLILNFDLKILCEYLYRVEFRYSILFLISAKCRLYFILCDPWSQKCEGITAHCISSSKWAQYFHLRFLKVKMVMNNLPSLKAGYFLGNNICVLLVMSWVPERVYCWRKSVVGVHHVMEETVQKETYDNSLPSITSPI